MTLEEKLILTVVTFVIIVGGILYAKMVLIWRDVMINKYKSNGNSSTKRKL